MSATMFSFRVLLLFLAFFCVHGQAPKRRFEYKLSFKGPHLVQRDNSIPFWEYFGDALAGDEGVRITPSLRSKKGSIWSKNKLESPGWEIEAALRITGRGRVGADGMAIWFTEDRGSEASNPSDLTVFGAADRWNGLGVFLDSFDNDGQHNNPYIMAVINDRSKSFDHQSDGSTQNLGGCLRDFRNKPYPVKIKVEYYKQMLSVRVHNGLTNNPADFELCLSVSNVVLPSSGYVGISAATGGLADDHDAISLLTHSLHDPTHESAQVSEAERIKFEEEFRKYQEELDRAKDEYQKEHPNERRDSYGFDEDEDWYQSQNEKDLKQVFDGQNVIHLVLKDLNRKLDELMGRQEMVLARVSGGPQGGPPPAQLNQGQQQQPPPRQDFANSIQRHEVDRLINNQNTLIQHLSDLKYVVNDVQQRTQGIQSQGNKGGGGGGGGLAVHDQMAIHEVKDRLATVSDDIKALYNKPQANVQCPPPAGGNCLTPTLFVATIVVQFLLTIGYMVYRSNKEAQAKKFY